MTRTPFSFRFLVVLLGIVALVFPIALIGQLGLVSRLNGILAEIQRTQQCRLNSGELLRAQIDEETAIHGYQVSGQSVLLQPFLAGSVDFPRAAAELRRRVLVTHDPGDDDIVRALDDAEATNKRWLRTVADPVLAQRATLDEVLAGKSLTDRVRGDVGVIDSRLDTIDNSWAAKRDAALHTAIVVAVAANAVIVLELIIFVAVVMRMRGELDRDRGVIDALQDATVITLQDHPAIDVGTAYFSATQGTRVGGDVFDVYRLDETTAMIVIGDVSGKGVEAAVDTTLIRYGLRAFAADSRDPAQIVTHFNALYAAADKPREAFVVLFVGIFDTLAGTLAYTSAGHEAAFIRRADDLERLAPTDAVVGLEPAARFHARVVDVGPHETIVLATDGLTEARDPRGTFVSSERLLGWITQASEASPQALVDDLAMAARRWTRRRISDDLAILAVRKKHSVEMGGRAAGRQYADAPGHVRPELPAFISSHEKGSLL